MKKLLRINSLSAGPFRMVRVLLALMLGVGVTLFASNARATFTPTTLPSFGNVPVGSTSTQSLTFTNSTGSTINSIVVSVTGSYSRTSTCPAVLLNGGFCTITVQFAPVVAGNGQSGVLRVDYNIVINIGPGTILVPAIEATNLVGNGIVVPGMPTSVAATPGNAQATISFTPPASDGGSPITGYAATCNPGAFSASGAASPLTVMGLTNGTAYICAVTASNVVGSSAASASVNVTPIVPPGALFFSGTGTGPIPDGTNACPGPGAPLDVTFNVAGISGVPADVSVSMTFSPAHAWVGDIVATLIAPNGTSFVIFGRTGAATAASTGDSSNLAGPYTFNNAATGGWWAAAVAAGSGVPIPSGSYRTSQLGGVGATGATTDLNAAFASIPTSNGTWILRFTDGCGGDTGSVSAASLTLTGGGLSVPGAPTGVTATAGNAQATVTFIAPVSNGGLPISAYSVTSIPAGGIDSNVGTTATSHVITGLTNGVAYTFTVRASNAMGPGAVSDPSNSVTPIASQTISFGVAPTIVVGSNGTVSATGGASGNPVIFTSTTPSVCSVSGVNGATVSGLSAGACTIAANQAGNGAFSAAPQVTQSFTVAAATRLINLSTRGQVQTGDNVMIGGFIIGGSSSKTVLIRAVGPNLANFGVPGVLANPTMQLFSGQTVIASNDDWQSNTNAAAIQATGLAPANSLESALLVTLAPGLSPASGREEQRRLALSRNPTDAISTSPDG